MSQLFGTPAVFCVEKEYQILIPAWEKCTLWLEINGTRYCDAVGGVLRSDTEMHRVHLPMAVLDQAKSYRICAQKIIDRKPYFPELGPVESEELVFAPLPTDREITVALVSDTHGKVSEPVAVCCANGTPDLLILDGDIPNYCDTYEDFASISRIAGQITQGTRPCVFARGNHDNRGKAAEKLLDYIPHAKGATYYGVRIGNVYALVLDCGEDKLDSHAEYGGTIDFATMRREETAYLEALLQQENPEWMKEEITHRLVICHIPFSRMAWGGVFDIERELYDRWRVLLQEKFHPHLMLCGHEHQLYVIQDVLTDPDHPLVCPTVISGTPGPGSWKGCLITLGKTQAKVEFRDGDVGVRSVETLHY